MRGEAILKALSFFNKAWDADTQSMSRKQSESVYLKDYRVSLNIAVQFESLDYWLEKHIGLAKGIGFLGRFLVNIQIVILVKGFTEKLQVMYMN